MCEDIVCGCLKCREHDMCTGRVPIFAGLSKEELISVSCLITRKRYEKGESIMSEGSRSDKLILINKGKVKIFRHGSDGREQILYILSDGDFLGERNLLKDRLSAYNAEALDKVDLCMIGRMEFTGLLNRYPGIGIKIMEGLTDRMEQLEDTLQSIGTKNAENRISAMLVDFAERYGVPGKSGIMVDMPLSREGIANYISTARETVSRKLNALQDEGIIRLAGGKRIIIVDMEALKLYKM